MADEDPTTGNENEENEEETTVPDPTFNTTAEQFIAREQLVAFLNTGSAQEPVWSPIGSTVTDGSMEYDWGEDTTQDILGVTRTTLKKPTVTQSFEGVKLYEGDAAYEMIWIKGIKEQNPAALCNLDLLIAHLYAGSGTTPFAERWPQSAIRPTSIGGEGGGFVEMPFDATYGGERSVGTVSRDSTTGAYSFSAAA